MNNIGLEVNPSSPRNETPLAVSDPRASTPSSVGAISLSLDRASFAEGGRGESSQPQSPLERPENPESRTPVRQIIIAASYLRSFLNIFEQPFSTADFDTKGMGMTRLHCDQLSAIFVNDLKDRFFSRDDLGNPYNEHRSFVRTFQNNAGEEITFARQAQGENPYLFLRISHKDGYEHVFQVFTKGENSHIILAGSRRENGRSIEAPGKYSWTDIQDMIDDYEPRKLTLTGEIMSRNLADCLDLPALQKQGAVVDIQCDNHGLITRAMHFIAKKGAEFRTEYLKFLDEIE